MKLEDILERKLPVYINETATNDDTKELIIPGLISTSEFLDIFDGTEFNETDVMAALNPSLVGKYGLWCSEGKDLTLNLKEAVKTTPTLIVPYLELDIRSKDSGATVIIFLTYGEDNTLQIYVPRKGNTLRLDTNGTLENSGIHDFKWEDKEILEQSDLLYIMKDVNRPALSKYLLRDIYQAFQEYQIDDIVIPNRDLCLREFEEKIKIK